VRRLRRFPIPLAACLLASIALPVRGRAQASPLDSSRVRERLERLIATDSTPSIVIGVARAGRVLWEQAFGWADKERRVRATTHTSYDVASVTKTFTATELMTLAAAGKLDIDKPANAYLHDLPPDERIRSAAWNTDEVTVRRLANHTGGLATHAMLCFAETPNCDSSVSRAIARYAVAIRMPGERFDYSNLDYGVLGTIVERVTEQPLADAMAKGVFRPLGMAESFVGSASGRASVAVPYTSSGARAVGGRTTTPAASEGHASIDDLLRFGMFHLHRHVPGQRELLADSVIDWMQNTTVRADSHARYGFGWWLENDHYGVREVYAAGATSVASALLILIPAEQIVVAVAANTGLPLAEIGDDLVASIMPSFSRARAIDASQRPADVASRPTRPLSSLLGSWAGQIATYGGSVPFALTIDSTGTARATVGSTVGDVQDATYSADGRMFGNMRGTLPVDELRRRSYRLDTELAPHGNRLTGYVTAVVASSGPEGIALSYWVDLRKQP
jgi:CubicO group peptidase (beta-lactamase class C family)